MKAICCIALAIILPNLCYRLQAQQGSGSFGQQGSGSLGTSTPTARPPFSPIDPADPYPRSPAMQQQIEKTRQNDRQRKLIADTNRLLALTAQLKSDTSQPSDKTPSADTIRRLDEIEKLARNVKERMKQ